MRFLKLGTVLAFLALVLAPPAPAATAPAVPVQAVTAQAGTAPADSPRTLFVGTSGITASDISPDVVAALGKFPSAAITNLHTRTASPWTCPTDGWMSVRVTGNAVDSAGRDGDPPCRTSIAVIAEAGAPAGESADEAPAPSTSTNAAATDSEDTSSEAATPSTSEATAYAPTAATIPDFAAITEGVQWPSAPAEGIAIGEGAALALADENGQVKEWLPAAEDSAQLARTIDQALTETQENVFVDVGWASGSAGSEDFAQSSARANERILAALHAYENYRAAHPADATRVVIGSLGQAWDSPALQFGAVAYPDGEALGLLYSDATRSSGLATMGDVRGMIAGDTVVIEEAALPGALAQITDDEVHARATRASLTPFFAGWGIFVGVGILAALIHFLHRPGREHEPKIWRNLAVWNTVAFAMVPAAMILNFIPWWRYSLGPVLPMVGVLAIAIILWLFTRTSPQPVGVIAAITLLLVSIDLVSGANYGRDGFFGSMTLTARRFYGVSNRAYVILLVSGLLAALPYVAKRFPQKRAEAARGVAAMGVAVLILDAFPAWGADFGGPAGIIAGFGLAYLLVKGTRPRWRHLGVWVLATAGVMALAGFIDSRSLRPSHIGLFWQNVGSADSRALVADKARDMLHTFAGNPLILAGVVVGIAVIVALAVYVPRLLARSDVHRQALSDANAPGVYAAVAGIALGAAIAVPINDSGVMILVDALTIGGTGVVAILARQILISRTRCTESLASDALPLEADPAPERGGGEAGEES